MPVDDDYVSVFAVVAGNEQLRQMGHSDEPDPWNVGSASEIKEVRLPRAKFIEKVQEIRSFLVAIAAEFSETDRIQLDEVSVSLTVETGGVLKWVIGASAGATLKFKIAPDR